MIILAYEIKVEKAIRRNIYSTHDSKILLLQGYLFKVNKRLPEMPSASL